MKVVKPQKLSLLTRCIEYQGRYRMGVSVLMHVPLGDDAGLFSEASLWKLAAEQLGKDGVLDVAVPKLVPEFLVCGHAYPQDEAGAGCAVRVRLADVEKTVLVFGDRYWSAVGASQPEPFDAMRLDWAHAYGGPEYAANPLGKGAVNVTLPNGYSARPLPNIEVPGQQVTHPDVVPEQPAGLGAIDQLWPQRASRAGTYDDAWLKTDFPGYPRDIDWRFFNIAPQDQWLAFPLKTDADYTLENVHPTKPHIAGRLPGFVARCFVNRTAADALQPERVDLRLGTVWFFPEAERAVLIFQGHVDVTEDDASDIRHILIAAEHAERPKPDAHYLQVLQQRLDKDQGALSALNDAVLLPEGLATADPALEADRLALSGEGRLQANLRTRQAREVNAARDEVARHGLDPDEHAPSMPPPLEPAPSLEELPDYIARIEAEADVQKAGALARAREAIADAEKQFAERGLSFDYVREELSSKHRGPPDFSAQAQLDSLEALAARMPDSQDVQDELAGYSKDPVFRKRLFDAEAKLFDAYRVGAQFQDAAPQMNQRTSAAVREEVLSALAVGASLAKRDLTGADLSGIDFTGADLRDVLLESATLTGCTFDRCLLAGAVLARAQLADASFVTANLRGANLSLTECAGARFDQADLREAKFDKADLRGATLRAAELEGADLSGAQVAGADLSEVHGNGLLFLEADLGGLNAQGASLAGAMFLRCNLEEADFSRAELTTAVFLAVRAPGICLAHARADNLRCVEGCDFSQADFSDASMVEANLRGSNLRGAQFVRTILKQADLSETDAREASFYLADARALRLAKADLQGAVLVSANLMDAGLQGSGILGADFRLANLFQADFARVHVDHSVQFSRALMSRMKTLPRRKVAPS